jgi:hypothetical protein
LPAGDIQFLTGLQQVYLFLYSDDGNTQRSEVYRLDLDNLKLTKLYSGGSRRSMSSPENRWSSVFADQLVFNISGSNIVSLEVQSAVESVLDP